VYCNNSLITLLDDIPIKYESSETTRAMGVLGKPIQYLSCSSFGGVKESGFGQNHKMALDHYRKKQVNLLRQRTG
jgi:acyl-CoA reductase-like NAD-dependent aldehyde dehydrogenase